MSPEEIKQVTDQIADFKAKSTQYAASSKALSAHYHRLYMASKASLKRFDRIQRTLEDKAYREERKRIAEKASTPAPGNKKAS